MRFLLFVLVFSLDACVVVCYAHSSPASPSPSAPAPPFIAVFFNASEQARCVKLLYSKPFRTPNEPQPVCEHHTLAFDPPTWNPWLKYFGIEERLRVLAHCMDLHDQAVLVEACGPLVSQNLYPHVTVACEPDPPYNAVYSNFLWSRLILVAPVGINYGI